MKSFSFYGEKEIFTSDLNTCKDIHCYILCKRGKSQLCVYHTQTRENFMMPENKSNA